MAEPTRFQEGSQHSAAERALTAHGTITQIHNRLTQIPATLGGAWQGESATVYTQVLNEWNPQFKKVIDALHTIAENLKASGIQYTEATTSSREVAENLRAALGGGKI
ncbi:WXG100 family type VII secretion target [Nonomuraea solani]|uniref:ESAT-6-like protein n=1 Tax=Nonomuraea solani TaxID=1144553 RepID=A0A1H5UYD6_9ACTN|nr:WXG100 family type VII secretion target [Nonomuraea solani]SEF80172.1 WXG100 family type VII secretion target [Nonomuraea solani]